MKQSYIITVIVGKSQGKNQLGFYTGDSFDTRRNKAKKYNGKGIATIIGNKFVKLPTIKGVWVLPSNTRNIENNLFYGTRLKGTVKKKRIVKKKNPITGSRKRREKKAATLFEDFTGHDADTFEMVNIPDYDTGLKIGKCLGIMYETIRDGNKENYLHEFKKTSQPDFAVSHDGQQIFLVGGNYLFKDSGINDI